MQIYFVISIDTEIDKSVDWKISAKGTYYSILEGIPNRLTPLFDEFGARPTYLLSPEVIDNEMCVRTLKEIKSCELGTHLHGELIEPKKTITTLSNNATNEMQCTYPADMEYQKLKNLTNLFRTKFGYPPFSFRAGRFGAGNNTIPALEHLGYLIDSSVTPGVDWNYSEGRSNYLKAKQQPYFPSKNNILEVGDSKVLEVPVTINSPAVRRLFYSKEKIGESALAKKMVDCAFPAVWLRPSWQSSSELIHVILDHVRRFRSSKFVVLNMMFHSIEIIPLASPYTKTEEECVRLMNRLRAVFKYCVSHNIQFVNLKELHPFFAKKSEK